jgi:hypothetical protein
MRILCEGNFKGLCPFTTSFGKRRFVRIVELRIPEMTALSIQKGNCENYLFVHVFVKRIWAELLEEGTQGRLATSQTVGNGFKSFPTKSERQGIFQQPANTYRRPTASPGALSATALRRVLV